eukprot:343001-Amphidinium_carterae.2
MEKGAIGMMQKINIKFSSPTQFDGRYPQLNEWSGEVGACLGVHNVNIEDIMVECTKFVTAIVLNDIQDKYTEKRSEDEQQPIHKQLLKEKMGTTTTWTSR